MVPTISLDIEVDDTEIELDTNIKNIARSFNTDKVVLKPTISASGFLTSVYKINSENKNTISLIVANRERKFIIQPYRDSIINGELSVVVLKGETLYAIIKRPGIFCEKSAPEYVSLKDTPSHVIESIKTLHTFFIKKFNRLPDICRIDFLENKGKYEILEVELIDPDLYIKYLNPAERDKVLSIFYNMV